MKTRLFPIPLLSTDIALCLLSLHNTYAFSIARLIKNVSEPFLRDFNFSLV